MKLFFFFVVFSVGFVTAIYLFVPAPQQQAKFACESAELCETGPAESDDFANSQLAHSINAGIRKSVDIAKAAVIHTAKIIKQKIDERQTQTDT